MGLHALGHVLQLFSKAADLGCPGWSREGIRDLLRSHPASVTPCSPLGERVIFAPILQMGKLRQGSWQSCSEVGAGANSP